MEFRKLALLLALMLVGCQRPTPPIERHVQQEVQQSHISGNVPSSGDFEPFLRRDLLSHFRKELPSTDKVVFEFLRQGPTQVGVAYPKFYLWAGALDKDEQLLAEGAVRVAAIEKTQFEVTVFLSSEIILAAPDQVGQTFPKALLEKILEKAKADK